MHRPNSPLTIIFSSEFISFKSKGFDVFYYRSKEMLIISVIHKLFGTIFGGRGNKSETWERDKYDTDEKSDSSIPSSFLFCFPRAADLLADGSAGFVQTGAGVLSET